MKKPSELSLIERYQQLLNEIEAHAKACGRNPSEIALVVVSKGHSWSEIKPLYNAGQRLFAENRLIEGLDKMAEAPEDVEWHFIGSIQKNKARKTSEHFGLIHSVGSFELAKKISDCGMESRILLQVNISGEASKHGMTQEECIATSRKILGLPGLSVEGLMTMAPLTEDEGVVRECFKNLRLLQKSLQEVYGAATFPHLSMGMSSDYRVAIEEGSTLLRIGSALLKS